MKKLVLLLVLALVVVAAFAATAFGGGGIRNVICGRCDGGDPYVMWNGVEWRTCHSPWYYHEYSTDGHLWYCTPSGWQ